MVEYVQSDGGYYYKVLKGGKKTRVSRDVYLAKTKGIMRGGEITHPDEFKLYTKIFELISIKYETNNGEIVEIKSTNNNNKIFNTPYTITFRIEKVGKNSIILIKYYKPGMFYGNIQTVTLDSKTPTPYDMTFSNNTMIFKQKNSQIWKNIFQNIDKDYNTKYKDIDIICLELKIQNKKI